MSSTALLSTAVFRSTASKDTFTRMVLASKPKWPDPKISLGEEFTPLRSRMKIRRRWDAIGPALLAFLEVCDNFKNFNADRDDLDELEKNFPIWGWTCCMVGKIEEDARPSIIVHCQSKACCERIVKAIEDTEWWIVFKSKYPAFSFIIATTAPRPILLADEEPIRIIPEHSVVESGGPQSSSGLQTIPSQQPDLSQRPVAAPPYFYAHPQAQPPRERAGIACRYCRRRKIRCAGFDASEDGRCTNCIRFNQECLFTPNPSQAHAIVPAHMAYPHLNNIGGQDWNPGRQIYSQSGPASIKYEIHGQPLGQVTQTSDPDLTSGYKYKADPAIMQSLSEHSSPLPFSTRSRSPYLDDPLPWSFRPSPSSTQSISGYSVFSGTSLSSASSLSSYREISSHLPSRRQAPSLTSKTSGDSVRGSRLENEQWHEYPYPIKPRYGGRCGTRVSFMAADSGNSSLLRSATIGGVILVGGVPFGLTVAHSFDPSFDPRDSVQTTIKQQYEDVEFLDDSDDGDDGEDLTAITSQASISSKDSSRSRSTTSSSGPNHLESEDKREPKVRPASSEDHAGDLGMTDLRRPDNVENDLSVINYYPKFPQRSSLFPDDDLDWALMPPVCWTADENVELRSVAHDVGDIAKPPSTSRLVKTFHSTKAAILGVLSASPFLLKVQGEDRFIKRYLVQFDKPISPGDCGTWVIDCVTRDLYGHIVAGQPSRATAFIIPAWDIKSDIEKRLQTTVTLPKLDLPGSAIELLEETFEAQMTIYSKGSKPRTVRSRLQFVKANDGQGPVTSIICTSLHGDRMDHKLSQSKRRYPHIRHAAFGFPTSLISDTVSFMGLQTLEDQFNGERHLVAEKIDYEFDSRGHLYQFRSIVFGKTLLASVPVASFAFRGIEFETEVLDLWESKDVRTVVFCASETSNPQPLELELASSDVLKDWTKPDGRLTLKFKQMTNSDSRQPDSITSHSRTSRMSSNPKGTPYQDLRIEFKSVRDRDYFARKIRHRLGDVAL